MSFSKLHPLVSLRPVLFFLLILALNPLTAQTPSWNWALNAGNNGHDTGIKLLCDPAGNVISLGSFQGGSLQLGSLSLPNLLTNGGDPRYLAKHDAAGNIVWANTFPDEVASIRDMSLDAQGNVYLIGEFTQTLTLGGHSISNPQFGNKPFVVKYNTSGQVIWLKQKGGDGNYALRVSMLWKLGIWDETHLVTLGLSINDTIDGQRLSANWLAKMDTAGNFSSFIRLDSLGLYGNPNGQLDFISINADKQQNTYISGNYYGVVPFDPATWTLDTIPGNNREMFLAKFDRNFQFVWSKMSHVSLNTGYGSGMLLSAGVTIDPQGNVFQIGNFNGDTLAFDAAHKRAYARPGPFTASKGNFLVKYRPDGSIAWDSVFRYFDPFLVNFTSICSDKTGKVYCGGSYSGPLGFSGMTPVYAGSSKSLFVAKFAQNGSAHWFRYSTLPGKVSLTGLGEDGRGNVYATGGFSQGNMALGNQTLTMTPAASSNAFAGDLFIARIGNCSTMTAPALSPNTSQHLCNNDSLLLTSSPALHYTWSTGDTLSSISVKHAGTYLVYGSDNLGCYAASPSVTITTGLANSSVTASGSTLAAQQATGLYQWLDCSQAYQAIPTATTQVFHPAQSGSYALAISQNGCRDTSACFTVTLSPVSVAAHPNASAIRFFPNPNRGQFFVEFPETGKPGQLLIADVLGKIVFEKTIEAGTSLHDAGKLADGVYQLILICDGRRSAQKMVIQR